MHVVFLCREAGPAKIQIDIRRQFFFFFNGSLIFQPKGSDWEFWRNSLSGFDKRLQLSLCKIAIIREHWSLWFIFLLLFLFWCFRGNKITMPKYNVLKTYLWVFPILTESPILVKLQIVKFNFINGVLNVNHLVFP